MSKVLNVDNRPSFTPAKYNAIKSFVGGAATAVLLALTACSSAMTKKDCEETNYYEMGLSDGKAGRSSGRLEQVSNECSKLGVEAAAPQYGYGRQAGLKEFCSESNARSDARSGKSDSICWHEAFPSYQVAYREALSKREADKRNDLKESVTNQEKADKKNKAINTELQQIEDQKAAH